MFVLSPMSPINMQTCSPNKKVNEKVNVPNMFPKKKISRPQKRSLLIALVAGAGIEPATS